MFGRYWLYIAAVGGCLIASFCLSSYAQIQAQPISESRGGQPGTVQKAAEPEEVWDRISPALLLHFIRRVTGALETEAAKDDSTDKTQREKDDLAAQQDMAWWARAMFWAVVAQTGIAAIGIWYIRQTLNQNRTATAAAVKAADVAERSVEAQRAIGMAQTRAYISVSDAVAEIRPGTSYPNLRYKVRNSGNSPALRLTATYRAAYNRNNGTFRAYPGTVRAYNGGFTIDIPVGESDSYGHVFEDFPIGDGEIGAMSEGHALSFEVVANIEFEDVFGTKISETVRFVTLPSATGKLGATLKTTSSVGFENWEADQEG